MFAIQLATLHGIVVATTCSTRNFEKAKNAGATYIFDYNDENTIQRIRQAMPQLSHVFDTIGNASSSAIAARALNGQSGSLCTVRPGKANTEDVPEHVKVTDVFVFTAFPKPHTYRNSKHWPVSVSSLANNRRISLTWRCSPKVQMHNHTLSAELYSRLPTLIRDGLLRPALVKTMGELIPEAVEKAMAMSREGQISGHKLCFQVSVQLCKRLRL